MAKDKKVKGGKAAKPEETPVVAPESVAKAPKAKAAKAQKVAKEFDYNSYIGKAYTPTQERLRTFLHEKVTDLTFKNKGEEAAFDLGARLAVALYVQFQRSPENVAARQAAASVPKQKATKEEAPVKPAKGKAAKSEAAAAAEAVVTPAETGEADDASTKANTVKGKGKAAKTAPTPLAQEAVVDAPVEPAAVATPAKAAVAPKRPAARKSTGAKAGTAAGAKAPF